MRKTRLRVLVRYETMRLPSVVLGSGRPCRFAARRRGVVPGHCLPISAVVVSRLSRITRFFKGRNHGAPPGSRVGQLPEGGQPCLGVLAAPGCLLSHLFAPVPGRRIGAEELQPGQLLVQLLEAVADDLVGDVALEVDDEAVVAEPLLGRTGLELGEVEAAGRELAEDLVQAPRPVGVLETDDPRPIVAGRRRYAVRAATSTNRVWLSSWSSMLGRSRRGRRSSPPAPARWRRCAAGALRRRYGPPRGGVRRHDLGPGQVGGENRGTGRWRGGRTVPGAPRPRRVPGASRF